MRDRWRSAAGRRIRQHCSDSNFDATNSRYWLLTVANYECRIAWSVSMKKRTKMTNNEVCKIWYLNYAWLRYLCMKLNNMFWTVYLGFRISNKQEYWNKKDQLQTDEKFFIFYSKTTRKFKIKIMLLIPTETCALRFHIHSGCVKR